MAKKLLLGIGGTGLEVIRHLRRRIVEANPEQGLAAYPNVGFLYIDTSPLETTVSEDNRKRWEVLGHSIQLKASEFMIIQAPAVGRILDNLSNYPQLREWLPIDELNNLDVAAKDTPGAQQIRPLGRMIFTLNYDSVKTKFANALSNLKDDSPGDPEIILACSLSGGTGAGMLLDVAYSVRRWLLEHGTTVGYLVLPDLKEEALRGRRYLANAYATLMDLNYFSQRRRASGQEKPIEFTLPKENRGFNANPLDFCYLVSTRNQLRETLSLQSLPDMIAHRIHLGLDSRITAAVAGMMNNGAMQRGVALQDPQSGNRFAQCFSTFGLSTIQYPTEQITEVLSARLLAEMIDSWLQPAPTDNVNQRMTREMSNLGLNDDYLLGNRDFFGQGQDFGPIPSEVDRTLTQHFQNVPPHNRAPYLNQVYANFPAEYRGGLVNHYRVLTDSVAGAADVIGRKIRSHIAVALTDSTLGYTYSLAALDEVARLLQIRRQAFETEKRRLSAKIKSSHLAFTAAVGEVTEAEGAILFRESKVKEALHKAKVAATINLTAQAEDRAYEFAFLLTGAVVERIATLKGLTIAWGNNMTYLKEELEKDSVGRLESLNNLQKNRMLFNGVLLFRADRIEALYSQLHHQEAAIAIREQLSRFGDPLEFDRSDESRRCFLDAALQWLSRRSTVRVSGKNVAQQLIEEYPAGRMRADLISRAYRASTPSLEFDQGEREAYNGVQGAGYTMLPTTVTHLGAMLDDEQGRLREVAQIRGEIVQATNLAPTQIEAISDKQQIVFISELTAFPLRVIAEVRTLKEAYDAHMQEEGRLPLHIQARFTPPNWDLMLMSEQEVAAINRWQEDFLAAWVLGAVNERGWFQSETNSIEGRPEIRYRYLVNGVSTFEALGETREQAFWRFCAGEEDLKDLRDRVNQDIERYIEKLVSARERAEVAGMLYTVMERIRGECRFGEDDPEYMRYHEIRMRLVKRFNLLRAGEFPDVRDTNGVRTVPYAIAETAVVGPGVSSTAESSAQGRLSRYLRVAIDQVAGKPSEKLSTKLEAKRLELGVSRPEFESLLAAAMAPYRPAVKETGPAAEYREMMKDFLDLGDGLLSDSAMAELVHFQASHGLSAQEVSRIEAEVKRDFKLV